MTRREALALVSSPWPLIAQKPAQPKTPSLCVNSKALPRVGYAELGEIVKQLGFDGVDLAIMPGGIVEPRLAPVDEVRAIESIRGAGLEAPIITTSVIAPYEPWARTVLVLAGRSGVGLLKCGLNQANASIQTKRDAFGLAYMGREFRIGVLISAGFGGVDYEPGDARNLVAGLDPLASGVSLKSDCFATKSVLPDDQLREILPVVKAVSIADFAWRGADARRVREWRPLGRGTVDFVRLFGALARTGFSGPITIEREYNTADEPGSLQRDAEFARKQIQMAYGGAKGPTTST